MFTTNKLYMPDPSPAGAIATSSAAPAIANGILQMGASLIDAHANKKSQQRQMDYQNEWAYRQREWAVQDRDSQNTYNSPLEVRKRMIAAGMNPALMYGGGVSAASSSQQPRAVQSPNVQMSPYGVGGLARGGSAALESYYDIRFKDAQLKQMELQNDLIAANIRNKDTGSQLNIDRSKLTAAQAAKVQSWLDGLDTYNKMAVSQNEVDNGQYTSTDVKRNYVAEGMFFSLKNQFVNYITQYGEADRRELYATTNADQVAAKIAQMSIQNARTQAETDNIRENLKLLQQSGVLRQIDINGQQILNKQFTGPAGQILLGLLKRADIIR